jgi:hypothetical protein
VGLFRKKAVVIEAFRFDGTVISADQWERDEPMWFRRTLDTNLSIRTLEGDMIVREGDWIIKGVNGEFYPCKPDIFEKTYEAEPPIPMTLQQQKAFDDKSGTGLLSFSHWTEFKADDESTWPKETGEYVVQTKYGVIAVDDWYNLDWHVCGNRFIVAYQPLPPKFEKVKP